MEYIYINEVMSLILNQELYLITSDSKTLIIHALTNLGYSYQEALKFMRKERTVGQDFQIE